MERIYKTFRATATKAAGDRRFTFTISNEEVDRENDRISVRGWKLADYAANPIVLWQHDRSLPPIARTVSIGISGDKLVATAEFPDASTRYDLAHSVHDLVAGGFLNAASVGFIPIKKAPNSAGGYDFIEQRLDEWSVVNLPALQSALVHRGEAGLDRSAVRKWFQSVQGDEEVLEVSSSIDDEGLISIEAIAAAALDLQRDRARNRVSAQFEPIDVSDALMREIPAMVLANVRATLPRVVNEAVRRVLAQARGRVD